MDICPVNSQDVMFFAIHVLAAVRGYLLLYKPKELETHFPILLPCRVKGHDLGWQMKHTDLTFGIRREREKDFLFKSSQGRITKTLLNATSIYINNIYSVSCEIIVQCGCKDTGIYL